MSSIFELSRYDGLRLQLDLKMSKLILRSSTQDWNLVRIWVKRLLGLMYLNAFLIAFNQAKALIGENGLLPMRNYLAQARFVDTPTLFFFATSDLAINIVALLGLSLSVASLLGVFDRRSIALSTVGWATIWICYLSFVNAGQTFWGFGWEMLILEVGFLAVFLGPNTVASPAMMPWLFRWLLFRLMFGAGMIKIRGDNCWLDLTCMYYHYETQPLPNPLSWFFHHLPPWLHQVEVGFTHFVELIVPFGFFLPPLIRWPAILITAFFQIVLILSGNLAWLNFMTLMLCVASLDDRLFYKFGFAAKAELGRYVRWFHLLLVPAITAFLLFLGYAPAKNLLASSQQMNASFDPLHLVNTYGAFGSVTKTRYELIIEGTDDEIPVPNSHWLAYEFKRKPGDVYRMPQQISPYYFKLDWQIWFAAMTPYWDHPWILNLVAKLLQNDQQTLALLASNPFPNHPPKFIRVERYEYHFTSTLAAVEDGKTHWWERRRSEAYLPPLSLDDSEFSGLLRRLGWLQ